jgi:hypothetical protein
MVNRNGGTVKGRSTKEARLVETRKTEYPKVDPNFKHCANTMPTRRDPPRIRGDRQSQVPYDERFFLRNVTGEFLHLSGTGFTVDRRCAYWGTNPQIDKLMKKDKALAGLARIPYRTVLGIGLASGQS